MNIRNRTILVLALLAVSATVSAQSKLKMPAKGEPECAGWVSSSFAKGKKPPFSFVYDGKSSDSFISKWGYEKRELPSGEDNVSIKIGDREVDLYTTTILCNIDLTNRCNMTCPICFAEANSAGYVYEPEYETIVKMLEMLRDEKPVRCTAVQFSGGEPTIYPRFLDVIRKAKELGFVQIQVASNGLKFRDFEFCKAAAEAGMNTIYLSFDGVSDDVYIQARARKMFHVKKEVLDNLRKLEHPPSVVLVPTVVKGVNDNQLGKIMEFAFENSDIVRGVNFQPVAFTGRITASELERGRFTIPAAMKEFAHIAKDVRFVGLFDRLQIWDRDTFVSRFEQSGDSYNKALADGIFIQKVNPFVKYKVGSLWTRTRKRAITKGDIQKLMALEIEPSHKTEYTLFAKDIFLFSYFTAGINFTDMATLRYGDIVDGRIYYSRHKTQKLLSFQHSNRIIITSKVIESATK